MRVLIIENEIYLAQSIANKLSELGYACEIASSAEQLKANTHYDVLLLSTNVSGFDKFITHHRQSVIILLVSYISVDSVVEPLGAGASDYIQKPFMVEELVRKIKHHQHYKELETMNNAYLNFIAMRLASVQLPQLDYKKIRLPVFLQAHRFANADAFLFHYAKAHKMSFFCVQASPNDNAESILKLTNTAITPSAIVTIFESAMPTMALAAAMILKAKLDTNLAISSIAFGVLFAFVSMPLLEWLLF